MGVGGGELACSDDAPSSGSGGAPAGTAGVCAAGECNFTVTHAPSTAIGTVEIVTFSVNLPSVTEARIEFGPTGSGARGSAVLTTTSPCSPTARWRPR